MKINLVYSVILLLVSSFVFVRAQDPTKVYISVYFNAVSKVDGVEQSFNADFYLTAYWIDNTVNGTYDPNTNFNPAIEFSNTRGGATPQIDEPYSLTAPTKEMLGIDVPAGTWVKFDQRYVGDFNTILNLIEFPFDYQDVVLQIESSLWDKSIVEYVPVANLAANMLPKDEPGTTTNEAFSVIEWTTKGSFVNQTEKYYKAFDQTYSRLEVKIFLERQAEYYIWKIILGSILLVIMCVCTFMLEVQEPDRMMGTLTVFLALVSFLFVATQSIPKVAYQTRLDNFFNFSFFVVFFILIGHTINYFVRPKEEDDAEGGESKDGKMAKYNPKNHSLSRKLDLSFAILFLIVYMIGCLSILIAPGIPKELKNLLDSQE